MMGEFAGQVALVTGAGSGIGRAVALQLAAGGAAVVATDLDGAGGPETVEQIVGAGGQGTFLRCDVREAAAVEAAVAHAVATYGKLTLACNNAGIGGAGGRTGEHRLEDWNAVIAVNLTGVFHCLRYELPALVAAGGGAIVNLASVLGQVALPGAPAYVAAKHGVVGLTRTAAIEYATEGVRVNAVGPGFIETPMTQGWQDDPVAGQRILAMHPLGRMGQPSEVAALICWLLSSEASYVTGGYYPVDGGYLAR